MAEFKKLSDVNVIESAGETTNLLAEENGEIVKVARNNAFNGLVKSVNGIMPDENGNISSYHLKKIQFADGSAFVPGLITPYYTETISEIVDMLRGAEVRVIFERMNMHRDGTMDIRNQIGHEFISGNDNIKVYFGDDLCPIILDSANNKMIFDPDWVAPVEPIPAPATAQVGQTIAVKSVDENSKPTEWEMVDTLPKCSTSHQHLVTDGSGVAKWEDRTHYKEYEVVYTWEGERDFYQPPLEAYYSIWWNDWPSAGMTYKITLDNVDYICTAKRPGTVTYMGNAHILYVTGDGEWEASVGIEDIDTGEPFCMLAGEDITTVNTLYTDSAHTISIHALVEKYVTIPQEYLPPVCVFTIKELNVDNSANNTCNMSFAELKAALDDLSINSITVKVLSDEWGIFMTSTVHVKDIGDDRISIYFKLGGEHALNFEYNGDAFVDYYSDGRIYPYLMD